MTLSDRIARARGLIQGGEKVYRACDQAGVSLQQWYRHRSGVEAQDLIRRMERLKKARQKAMDRLKVIELRIALTAERLKVAIQKGKR